MERLASWPRDPCSHVGPREQVRHRCLDGRERAAEVMGHRVRGEARRVIGRSERSTSVSVAARSSGDAPGPERTGRRRRARTRDSAAVRLPVESSTRRSPRFRPPTESGEPLLDGFPPRARPGRMAHPRLGADHRPPRGAHARRNACRRESAPAARAERLHGAAVGPSSSGPEGSSRGELGAKALAGSDSSTPAEPRRPRARVGETRRGGLR